MQEALLQALAPLAVAWAYFRRCRTLAARGMPVPGRRQALFYAGVGMVLVAAEPPLARIDEELLLAHMTQHVVLGDLAPLLIVLGVTGPVVAPLLRLHPIGKLRKLAHPLIAFPLWALDLYVWHLPVLYQATLHNELVHAFEHALFLGLGILMWVPLVGPLPVPAWFGGAAKLLYVIAVRLAATLLANVLLWAGVVLYPDYGAGEAAWGISPLGDQIWAGAILMIEGSIVTLVLMAWLFLDIARRSDESQALLDFAVAQGVALTPERVARAVAAGRGRELRRRIAGEGARRAPGSAAGGSAAGDPEA